ncbi:MAG: hypothetical protein GEV09_18615 [Pseudonocardiaceae bacterium]|nr:hypothetical protein [Pseudonocardiaceae bacterium]
MTVPTPADHRSDCRVRVPIFADRPARCPYRAGSRWRDAGPPADLLAALVAVPDPRAARGVRHRLVTVLAVAVCAVLAGARTYVAVAEWAHDLPVGVRVRLGLGRRPPCESTIRRVLQAVDAEARRFRMNRPGESSWLGRPGWGKLGMVIRLLCLGNGVAVAGPAGRS